jgi:hypothetical protein
MQELFWPLILWAVLSALVGAVAHSRGRVYHMWFLLSLLVSPLVGYIVLMAVSSDKQRCKNCGKFVWSEANECPYCHIKLKQQRLEAQASAQETR